MKSEGDKNMKLSSCLSILAITSIICGCKRSYTPPAITANNNYLVVEGVIVAGQDSTVIKLSRTVNLSGTTTKNPELNATVTVEGDQNVSYTLPQVDSGRYGVPSLNLDNSHQYRLNIKTADGRTYLSDYVPVKITPPIDTFEYNITAGGINFYLNTHDPANNTHFYRWDYSETYIYESPINSNYIFDPTPAYDTLKSVIRTPAQQIHICYVTLNSSTALINSSAALKQDVINNDPITQVPSTSEKLLYKYSIIVRQYALTSDAYNFWTLLKRNTEQLGTIFDAQPSANNGNIHCTSNPAEPVIGYVSASTISEKRIFIDRTQLPASWPFNPPQCSPYSICWFMGGPVHPYLTSGISIPIGLIKSGGCGEPPAPGYVVEVGDYDCVDCRTHLGGVTQVPSFWQ